MRRHLLALGGVALLATACGSSQRTSSPTTAPAPIPAPVVSSTTIPSPATTGPPPTLPSTTVAAPTTTVPNTTLVPSTITVAYVDAVLVQLNHIYGDAVRTTVKADKLTPGAIRYLKAIYNAPLGKEEQGLFRLALADRLPNVRAVPGDPVSSVQKLIYASSSCIYVRVRTNSDPALIKPVPPLADEFMGLQHASGSVAGIDRPPWIFFFDGVTKTVSNIPNQCPEK
jgi:hypothetical protein